MDHVGACTTATRSVPAHTRACVEPELAGQARSGRSRVSKTGEECIVRQSLGATLWVKGEPVRRRRRSADRYCIGERGSEDKVSILPRRRAPLLLSVSQSQFHLLFRTLALNKGLAQHVRHLGGSASTLQVIRVLIRHGHCIDIRFYPLHNGNLSEDVCIAALKNMTALESLTWTVGVLLSFKKSSSDRFDRCRGTQRSPRNSSA